MSVDFSKFDEEVDLAALQGDVEEAKKHEGEFEDLPKGTYIVSIEKMELGATKEGNKPMFTVQCKVLEGEYKGRNIFMNRVIYGNKNSEKWNDGKAIRTVIAFLEKLQTQTVPEFVNYSQFADCILDIYEEIQGKVEVEIEHDSKAFNPISIKEVYDV